ncbi:hypothetical protein P8C59_008307 [Phyllachora maydis]|uniref:Mannitol 2-dehydrogenase n=1 Tax=Phyllachora maydis TaxID=1825666 RepID=A0AAD9MGN0_9PEZI|nr:hypothetical protein P8C59_008307 [Phyllachora maydis]
MAAALPLTAANLPRIAAATAPATAQSVAIPTYDRQAAREGIVHVGVGGFHRAHLAVYVDRLMQDHGCDDYAICGVGLQPGDAAMRDVLAAQDHLYTVVERSAAGARAQVVGSIRSFLFAPDDRAAVVAKMAHAHTHIVSLTITESGYYYNENTHELQADHADIRHDLDPAQADQPVSIFGFLYAALARRKAAGLRPFTVLSCDNMQKNGAITRHMLETFARLRGDAAVADWIGTHGAFPNSMVDRITPRTSDADVAALAADFAVADKWPVVTEPFMQWVVEDAFSDGRPALERVGVQVVGSVRDVEQFEMHKLRLLNGSHSAIGYPGTLAGFAHVHEVMADADFGAFVWRLMQDEVKPLLPAIPGVDVDAYCRTLVERFANPTIMDQLPRICLNASGKIPQFIMPSIAEAIWSGRPFRRLVFVAAAWFRYLHGRDDEGRAFAVDDPMRDELQRRARAGGLAPHELLGIKTLFGDDLRTDKRFLDEMTTAMELIARDGVRKTLPKYVD